VRLLVEEEALEQTPFPSVVGFPLLIIILQLVDTHPSPPSEVWDNPDLGSHYHILGL
jgi:hypothetical protein